MLRTLTARFGITAAVLFSACGTEVPLLPTSEAVPVIMATPGAQTSARQPSSTVPGTLPGVGAAGQTTVTTFPAGTPAAGSAGTGAAAIGPANLAAGIAPAPVGVPATVATQPPAATAPKPTATPKPTSTPKPTATPIPAGALTVTSASISTSAQSSTISVTVKNQSSVAINAYAISVSWLDGNHPRGGEFGEDAPEGWTLIEPGASRTWKNTVASGAVTRPITASVTRSTAVGGVVWTPPPGTAPYIAK